MKKSIKISLIIIAIVLFVAAILFTATGIYQNSPGYRLNLGDRYLSELNYEQAIIEFEKLVEIDPYNPDVWLKLAEAYEKNGNLEKSKEKLEEALTYVDDDRVSMRLAEIKLIQDPIQTVEKTYVYEEIFYDYFNRPVIYTGDWENGKPNGQGTGKWEDGDVYSGHWVYGSFEGEGEYTWGKADYRGDKYIGQFRNGKKSGQGKYYWAAGHRYEGQWKNDVRHGEGIMYYADGSIESGQWENGEFIGENASNTTVQSPQHTDVTTTTTTSITTQEVIVELLEAPSNIKCTSDESTITIKWSEVNGAYAYKVLKYNSTTNQFEEYITTKDKSCLINNLQSNKEYKFKITTLTINDNTLCDNETSDIIICNTKNKETAYAPASDFEYYEYDGGIVIYNYIGRDEYVNIPNVIKGLPVIEIAGEGMDTNPAFYNKKIKGVTIPNSVKKIGDWAFWGCENLEEVTIPGSVAEVDSGAFMNCSNLKRVVISEGVKYIYLEVFKNCTKLKTIDFPATMPIIYSEAFENTPWLAERRSSNSLVIVNNVLIDATAAKGSIKIPNGVKIICPGAFSNCSGITKISIPNTVTTIGTSAFSNCSSITEITIPNSVTIIDSSAFWGCSGLEDVSLPNSLKELGRDAFNYCKKVKVTYKGKKYKYSDLDDLYALFN